MSDSTAGREPQATESSETVKVSLLIVYSINSDLSLLDAMAAAKAILDAANEHGSATGEVVMGRKRFQLR